jgi:hypothetical protein
VTTGSLIAILAAGLGAWIVRRVFAGYPPTPLPTLARREAAFVVAASDAMFPAGGEIPESGTDAGIPEYIDGYVAAVPSRQKLLMRALFFLMEHVTILFPAPGPGGRRRFSGLSDEQRLGALEGWRTSPSYNRRMVFMALRSLITMGYFACPPVLQRLDLSPMDLVPPVVEADLLFPPAGRSRDAIRHTSLRPEPLAVEGADAPVHPDFRAGSR